MLQANRLPARRFVIAVLPIDELNAYACGGHLVVVTSYAIDTLPRDELSGVLAHELSHHLGSHTVALTIGHWLSLPVFALARIGFFLQNVATAATRTFASRSSSLTVIGQFASALLMAVSWVFLSGLLLSNSDRERRRAQRRAAGRSPGGHDGVRPTVGQRTAAGDRRTDAASDPPTGANGWLRRIRRRAPASPRSRPCCGHDAAASFDV